MTWMRATLLLGLISIAACVALVGPVAIAPQRAAAADEIGGEVPTPEEPPPVVETPTETEPPVVETEPPAVETPVTTPPGELPPAGEGATPPSEAPKSGGSPSSEAAAGGGGGGSNPNSGSTGVATVSPGPATTHRASHVRSQPTHRSGGGGGSQAGAGGGNGGGNAGNGNGGAKGGQQAPSNSGGGSPNPTVSPQVIDEGATAVSHVAAHVGEVFAEALPTAPLKEIGTRLAAHTGLIPPQGGPAQKQAVDRLGTALGAALIGSAVAVEKAPAASQGPIPFFDPPGGKSGTIYLLLIAALLLVAGALVLREVRSGFGLTGSRTGLRGADEKLRLSPKVRADAALSWAREVGARGFSTFRRLRSHAVAGLRSLF